MGWGVATPQTTNASSLAGGVKGSVSWLLGDQSWLEKISGPKPAKENLPACFSHVFSASFSVYLHSLPSFTLRARGKCAARWSSRWAARYRGLPARTWWCLSVSQWPTRAVAALRAATGKRWGTVSFSRGMTSAVMRLQGCVCVHGWNRCGYIIGPLHGCV